MMFAKITSIFLILAIAAIPVAMGQDAESGEPETLTVEMMVIREASVSTSREQNLFALDYIENAIGRGNTGDDIYSALERLVLAGSKNRTLSRGQVINNFPDVRQEAARQLGTLGTEEARAILLRAGLSEREPIVMAEIITALSEIEAEDNAQTVSTLVWVAGRFHRSRNPNNHVALATVNALERFAERDGGITNHNAFHYLFAVAEGPYVTSVRNRAWEIIDGLRGDTGEE
ncbi:MAG: HEAT repeat domain-containing protein [Treponema sp.]|nr:HEAT repeat domain-containing protein [Treponema sp.]